MKNVFPTLAILFAFVVLPIGGAFASLDDLAAASPDDIMLRKPAAKPVAVKPAEAPKPVAKPAEAPKPVAKPAEAPKPVAKPAEAPKPVAQPQPAMTAEVKTGATDAKVARQAKNKGKKASGRPAVITAERTDYDRKEGVILFDRNVFLNDEQYQMHADRLFVFLDGTNELKRIVALGHVALTNETKTAGCAKVVYTKSLNRIVLYGAGNQPAWLCDSGKKDAASTIRGMRITYWIDSEQAEVDGTYIELPGLGGSGSPVDLVGGARRKDAKKMDK